MTIQRSRINLTDTSHEFIHKRRTYDRPWLGTSQLNQTARSIHTGYQLCNIFGTETRFLTSLTSFLTTTSSPRMRKSSSTRSMLDVGHSGKDAFERHTNGIYKNSIVQRALKDAVVKKHAVDGTEAVDVARLSLFRLICITQTTRGRTRK